jgi:hypothetical protein
MPAIFAAAGDCDSSIPTAPAVVQLLLSQSSETSSSVGPIPPGVDGDSDDGRQWLASRMMAGDAVTGPFDVMGV